MAVTITPEVRLTAVESYAPASAEEIAVQHNKFNQSGSRWNATSVPPVSMVSYQTYALVTGSKTIDLTAILNFLAVSQNGTGLKVQSVIFVNPAGNATMNIAPGGSNPYPLFGTGNDIDVPGNATVNSWIAFGFPEGLPDVASGAKTITVTGTGTQTFNLGIVLG
jgi:hypothetical protein